MGAVELPVPCDVIEVEVRNVLALDFVAFDASCFPCHSDALRVSKHVTENIRNIARGVGIN